MASERAPVAGRWPVAVDGQSHQGRLWQAGGPWTLMGSHTQHITLKVGSSFWKRARAFMKAGMVSLARGVKARLMTGSGTLIDVMASLQGGVL